ncbi:hypothetical protein Lepto7376_2225 [[Leptolyngbya] sp. PCC 7376]|uniref:hypothetical protein n=1 Tax=[Leptolyngbya] sp. PCC 7376 TaxID=111781 RepID=UPI00029F4CF5|nr:hypothetical protein [[Leptolyngbya] sp. PCC 7376]AFY38515.1 hypothetical protein Lepto7376_2225 [[Leptolyngbya] sp. PCC 7376]
MDVSLFHRLAGAWLGYRQVIVQWPELETVGAIADQLWQEFLVARDWEKVIHSSHSWQPCPLENALALLPVLLFFHEDPSYLGDRLGRCNLPSGQLAIVQDLGQCLSDCLRENIVPDQFSDLLERRSPEFLVGTAFLESAYDRKESWQGYQKQLTATTFTPAAKLLLRLYGAMIWSGGNCRQGQTLLQHSQAIVQVWGKVLWGALCGDRHSNYRYNFGETCDSSLLDVIAFWSRWSGLPIKNRLELEQLPVIANAQGLKSRPSLQLISQRHLT